MGGEQPLTAHLAMWLMSMRGRPRGWRMMQGWPVNTFRLINEEGRSTLLEEANGIGGWTRARQQRR